MARGPLERQLPLIFPDFITFESISDVVTKRGHTTLKPYECFIHVSLKNYLVLI